MNKLIVLSFLPLAMACTKKPASTAATNIKPAEKIAQAATVNWQQIMGTVEYQEKCAEKTISTSCLAVIGGDDLVESRTYFIPGGDKSAFERIPSNTENKKFRVHLGNPSSTADVTENQHVALLAQLDTPTADGNQRIGELKALHVVEK